MENTIRILFSFCILPVKIWKDVGSYKVPPDWSLIKVTNLFRFILETLDENSYHYIHPILEIFNRINLNFKNEEQLDVKSVKTLHSELVSVLKGCFTHQKLKSSKEGKIIEGKAFNTLVFWLNIIEKAKCNRDSILHFIFICNNFLDFVATLEEAKADFKIRIGTLKKLTSIIIKDSHNVNIVSNYITEQSMIKDTKVLNIVIKYFNLIYEKILKITEDINFEKSNNEENIKLLFFYIQQISLLTSSYDSFLSDLQKEIGNLYITIHL